MHRRHGVLLFAALFFCAALNAEQPLFRNALINPGGPSVLTMRTADVNNDGKADVVLSEKLADNSFAIVTLPGNGDGTFRSAVTTSLAAFAQVIALAELDGDGKTDLVLTGSNAKLETYHGNGDGSFTIVSSAAASLAAGSPLVLTDLDGDGRLDLLAVMQPNSNSQALATFRGNGNATFAAGIAQPGSAIQQSIGSLAIGDFNGDGRTDVLETANRLATGKGDGTFNAPIQLTLFTGSAVAGDFNRDGKSDYVTIGVLSATVNLANGDGTFTKGATYTIGEASSAGTADMDGDGNLDVVVAGGDLVTVMRSAGDGTFAVHAYAANSNSFVAADFDGDHRQDILALRNAAVFLLRGNGDGTLAAYKKSFLRDAPADGGKPFNSPAGLAAVDLNGDGKSDAVTQAGPIIILFSNGDGGLGAPVTLPLPSGASSVGGFTIADVNGDGNADIVAGGSKFWTYLGNGHGAFVATSQTAVAAFSEIALVDVDGDGRPDALLGGWGDAGQLLLGNGDGTFAAPKPLPGDPLFVADFNGDGRMDFVSYVTDRYTIYLNNGSGGFTAKETVTMVQGPFAVGDFNGDGKTDLVEEQYNSLLVMRLGKGDGTFTNLPPFLLTGLSSFVFSPHTVTADFDGDGKLDLAFSNHVLLGNGDGTFRAFVPAVIPRGGGDIAAGDIDGNGSVDLLLLDPSNSAINALVTRTAAAGIAPLPLSLTTSVPTLHPGEVVTLTASATNASNFVPSGSITFSDNGTFIGFGDWSNGSATLKWDPTSNGDHTIVASFVGDDVFAATSVSIIRLAVKLDSVIFFELAPSTSQQQEPTSIFASVSSTQGSLIAPTGTFTIREGDTILLSTSNIPTRFVPILTYRFPTLGTHALTADYSGDANYKPATATATQLVTRATVAVGLSGTPASPLTAGQTLKLTAFVSAFPTPAGGTVTFRENGGDIGTAPVIGSFASITIQPSAGYHSYVAVYSGNADLGAATSNARDFVVNALPCSPPANCTRRRAVH
jgi:hypothetical protein